MEEARHTQAKKGYAIGVSVQAAPPPFGRTKVSGWLLAEAFLPHYFDIQPSPVSYLLFVGQYDTSSPILWRFECQHVVRDYKWRSQLRCMNVMA